MEERRQCAYVLAIRSAIEFAKAGNADLFTDDELATFARIEALDEAASRVCSRLVFRRGLWIRPSSVRKYIQLGGGEAQDDSALIGAIQTLADAGIVSLLTGQSDFATAWSVVEALCKVEELLEIYRIVCGVKYKGKSSREEILSTLHKSLTSQRTVLGIQLSSGFAKRLSAILSNSEGVPLCPFSMNASVAALIRRAQRLYQIASSMPSGSSGVISAHEVLEFCAPLMVIFKLVSYAPYSLCPRAASSAIFSSRRSFLQWEAAVELRSLVGKLSAGPIPASLAKKVLSDVLCAFDNCNFSETFIDSAPSLGSWLEVQFFRDLQQLGEVGSAALLITAVVFLLSLHSLAEASEVRPEESFLLRIQAGSVLASLAMELASALEKNSQHRLAILVYLLLLRLPYHPHRRGSWYIRLCVDSDHLSLRALSLVFAQAGLQDPLLQPADEVDLLHRTTQAQTRKAVPDAPALELEAWVRRLGRISMQHQLQTLSALILREATAWFQATAELAPDAASTKPAAQAVAADKTTRWACPACTFMNTGGKACAICCTERSVPAAGGTVDLLEETEVVDLCSDGEDGEESVSALPASTKLDCLLSQLQQLSESVDEADPASRTGMDDTDKGDGESATVLDHCVVLLNELGGCDRRGLRCFDVRGRRFGDPQRKGKSRFCGQSGELMTVEDLVQEKCWQLDPDSCDAKPSRPASRPASEEWTSVEYTEAVAGGGWRGWHDEGSLVRSVCGLLMWEVFFSSPSSGAPVFLTPHQDAPLDFSSPSYYARRQAAVESRVRVIGQMSAEALAIEVARLHHTHRGRRCAAVSWDSFSLAGMQVAAMSLGGKALAALCLAFSRSHRQFRSGGPDLFLVRARGRPSPSTPSTSGGSVAVGIPAVDLDVLMGGTQWRLPPPNSLRASQGLHPDLDSLSEGPLPATPVSIPPSSRPPPATATPTPKRGVLLSPPENAVAKRSPELQQLDEKDEEDEGGDEADSQPTKKARFVQDEELPESVLCAVVGGDIMLESMLVEVKGPSDALANKQVIWLQLLGLLAPAVQAFVCHVKES